MVLPLCSLFILWDVTFLNKKSLIVVSNLKRSMSNSYTTYYCFTSQSVTHHNIPEHTLWGITSNTHVAAQPRKLCQHTPVDLHVFLLSFNTFDWIKMLNSTLRFILLNNFLCEEYKEQRMRNLLYFVSYSDETQQIDE